MSAQTQPARRRITIERSFQAPVEEVWKLWTTKEGIESWWGPDGFEVKVRRLDVRLGGELLYAMTATAPEQIGFLKKAGMAQTTESLVTYTDVVPLKRLAFTQMADFIPGVTPYAVATTVEDGGYGLGAGARQTGEGAQAQLSRSSVRREPIMC